MCSSILMRKFGTWNYYCLNLIFYCFRLNKNFGKTKILSFGKNFSILNEQKA